MWKKSSSRFESFLEERKKPKYMEEMHSVSVSNNRNNSSGKNTEMNRKDIEKTSNLCRAAYLRKCFTIRKKRYRISVWIRHCIIQHLKIEEWTGFVQLGHRSAVNATGFCTVEIKGGDFESKW